MATLIIVLAIIALIIIEREAAKRELAYLLKPWEHHDWCAVRLNARRGLAFLAVVLIAKVAMDWWF